MFIIIIIISFMQGIFTYISDTNFVPRKYSVAAVLLLLFMVLISLVYYYYYYYCYKLRGTRKFFRCLTLSLYKIYVRF